MDTRHRLELADIPGLGPVRRDALAEAGIVDLPGLLALKVSELAAVRGIGLWQARKIREFLRQRGLLVEESGVEGAAEDAPIVIHQPETMAEAEAVAEVMAVIEAQTEAEARVEAEVQLLTEALEAAQAENGGSVENPAKSASSEGPDSGRVNSAAEKVGGSASDEIEPDIAAEVRDAEPADDGEEQEEQDESPEVPGDLEPEELAEVEATGELTEATTRELMQEIQTRRERLPEAALTLIEAIRQAAVSKQLTRQVTRLLITSGEFASVARPDGTAQLRTAAESLAQVEELLQRALEKEAFSEKAQKELADRIRKRRKSLDRLLEEPEVEDR